MAVPFGLWAIDNGTAVPMRDRGASTFYVSVAIEGYGDAEFLVDTGAAYTTIDQATLTRLKDRELATYVRDLESVLADGTPVVLRVYRIAGISIGGVCMLRGVEAAVLPGASRSILGLNALRRTAPFLFSMEPPVIRLSNCPSAA